MNQEVTHAARRGKTYRMAMTALMAAVTCVIAPMAIPIGPVPISFTNLAIYLSLYLLGWKRGTVSYLVYVLIGMVGVPVFSGFAGGMGRLLGPTGATGGYIVGFIPMAVIAGLVIDRYRNRGLQLAGMIVGTAVCYAFGTAWFLVAYARAAGPIGLWAALGMCVFPFVVPDLVKLALAWMLSRRLAGCLR